MSLKSPGLKYPSTFVKDEHVEAEVDFEVKGSPASANNDDNFEEDIEDDENDSDYVANGDEEDTETKKRKKKGHYCTKG